jgi:hypothetical protein
MVKFTALSIISCSTSLSSILSILPPFCSTYSSVAKCKSFSKSLILVGIKDVYSLPFAIFKFDKSNCGPPLIYNTSSVLDMIFSNWKYSTKSTWSVIKSNLVNKTLLSTKKVNSP